MLLNVKRKLRYVKRKLINTSQKRVNTCQKKVNTCQQKVNTCQKNVITCQKNVITCQKNVIYMSQRRLLHVKRKGFKRKRVLKMTDGLFCDLVLSDSLVWSDNQTYLPISQLASFGAVL